MEVEVEPMECTKSDMAHISLSCRRDTSLGYAESPWLEQPKGGKITENISSASSKIKKWSTTIFILSNTHRGSIGEMREGNGGGGPVGVNENDQSN